MFSIGVSSWKQFYAVANGKKELRVEAQQTGNESPLDLISLERRLLAVMEESRIVPSGQFPGFLRAAFFLVAWGLIKQLWAIRLLLPLCISPCRTESLFTATTMLVLSLIVTLVL